MSLRAFISRFDCEFQGLCFMCGGVHARSDGEYEMGTMHSILATRELEPYDPGYACPAMISDPAQFSFELR
jgi:hypothetical protein